MSEAANPVRLGLEEKGAMGIKEAALGECGF
jgi:hypothetical protein